MSGTIALRSWSLADSLLGEAALSPGTSRQSEDQFFPPFSTAVCFLFESCWGRTDWGGIPPAGFFENFISWMSQGVPFPDLLPVFSLGSQYQVVLSSLSPTQALLFDPMAKTPKSEPWPGVFVSALLCDLGEAA